MNLTYRLKSGLAKLAINTLKLSGCYEGFWSIWRGELFSYAEKKGLHIMPVHYYSPIPTQEHVRTNHDNPTGFDLDPDGSADAIMALIQPYQDELTALFDKDNKTPHDYHTDNSAYSPLDAAILYSRVRRDKPARLIEIGCGHSTLVISAALRANKAEDPDYKPHFTCIEPYLPEYLKPLPAEVDEVLENGLQEVPMERFTSLAAGDLLFIDSTHVVEFASDVVYEYLQILPKVQTGVIIHIHDIFLPYDYPPKWLLELKFFWTEQYLLQAFLSLNPCFRVDFGAHAATRSGKLEAFPLYSQYKTSVFPASFWMTRTS